MGRAGHWVCAALAMLALAGPSARAAATIAIVGATVVHPEREGAEGVAPDSTVIVEGERIRAAGPARSTPVPKGARVIDGKGKWVIPGLVDSHVHFFQSGNLYTRPDVADFNRWMPYAKEVARNQARLPETFRVWLASGVTSVVDIGGPFWNFGMRDAAARSAAAPRVHVAGPAHLHGGPRAARPGRSADHQDHEPGGGARARAPRARAQARLHQGLVHPSQGDDLAAQEAIVRATAEEAHAAGVRLAVHATELVVAKSALRVGADFLVHSVDDEPVDDEFIALARRNHALYCPTLFVTMGYRYALSNTWKPTEAERRLADPQILAAMHDLDRIPKDMIPERVAKLMAEPRR